jgi:hypothetical protein
MKGQEGLLCTKNRLEGVPGWLRLDPLDYPTPCRLPMDG